MTTTVKITACPSKPAYVRQIAPAVFDGDVELAERRAMPVTVPAGCEATFYVFDGQDILVSESAPLDAGE